MPASLQIVLKDGFANETVRIDVNGRTVLDKAGVTTRMQIGLAEMLQVGVDARTAEVAVSVPSRGIEERIVVNPSEAVSLELSLVNGKLTHRTSNQLVRAM